jgi:glutaminyl-peptide cyclotransferase
MIASSTSSGAWPLAAASVVIASLALPARATEIIVPEIVATHPHDTTAFTEGLLFANGVLYESTGNYGQSTLREVNPTTGTVLRHIDLGASYFGEGLARVGEQLTQLTWQEHVAFIYDRATFALVDTHIYTGEGWGLCYDGTRFVMSDGTDRLQFRDPATFALLDTVGVTVDGVALQRLNELECVGDVIFANVWYSNVIVRIEPSTGIVTTQINCSGLLTIAEAQNADVLNGIAFNPATGTFFITGKLWPKLFEARFGNLVPAPDGGPMKDGGPQAGDPTGLGDGARAPTDPAKTHAGCCAAGPADPSTAALILTLWITRAWRRRSSGPR